jgi:hypothetical protein
MSSWAKFAGDTWISRSIAPAAFPNDFWGQVDVWIPPETFVSCFNNDLFGFTASFIDFGDDSLLAKDTVGLPTPTWRWLTDYGTVAPTGPAPSTTYTIKFHYVYGGGSSAVVDWYVNGVLVAHDSGVNHFNQSVLFINHQPEDCCCEIYYYTNVRVGTADGAADIINDDFSGGLGAWTRNQIFMPSGLAVVAAPVAAACPTLTLSPVRGLPGDTFTVTGTGFAPSRPLQMFFGSTDLGISESSDGSGNASFTTTVPHVGSTGTFSGYSVYLLDDEANVACSESFEPGGGFDVCGGELADGITTAPNPLVAVGGITNNSNKILDYIFHDGAHWVLWQDVSVTTGLTTFPPPTNHTMNATRISADGSSVVDYPMDTNYRWVFDSGGVGDPGLSGGSCGPPRAAPVWDSTWFFSSWEKPIYDAHFASDGTNLWVAVLTQETVPYPWLDNLDKVGLNPGSVAQFVPLATLTAGFTSFPTSTGTGFHRYNTQTTGPLDFYQSHSFPVTDSGDTDTGYWSIYVVAVFAFNGAAFNRIGDIQAKYCPGSTTGYGYGREGSIIGGPVGIQHSPRGSVASTVAVCASPNDPGRCHLVWSEGGDWGRVGLGNPADCTCLVWDQGPQNRSYRVNYTTWSPTAKLTDSDISSSHIDRTNWFFINDYGQGGGDFEVGYTFPDQADCAFILDFALRNDNDAGTPYLFATIPQSYQNIWNPNQSLGFGGYQQSPAYIDPHGHPFLDFNILYSDTLNIFDLSSGAPVLVQSLDLSTLAPTNAEVETFWPATAPYADPLGPNDCVLSPAVLFNSNDSGPANSYGPNVKTFGVSLPYDDPELGLPVYLVHIPLTTRWIPQAVPTPPMIPSDGEAAMRVFYRVPCDMSAPFDYLDGVRQLRFTILKEPFSFAAGFEGQLTNNDFFSDPKNIWIPPTDGSVSFGFGFNGFTGGWFDRVCFNTWSAFSGAWTPNVNGYWAGSQSPGFYYDPVADSITTTAGTDGTLGGPLFSVTTQFICRGCRNCKCGTGIHIAHRF